MRIPSIKMKRKIKLTIRYPLAIQLTVCSLFFVTILDLDLGLGFHHSTTCRDAQIPRCLLESGICGIWNLGRKGESAEVQAAVVHKNCGVRCITKFPVLHETNLG